MFTKGDSLESDSHMIHYQLIHSVQTVGDTGGRQGPTAHFCPAAPQHFNMALYFLDVNMTYDAY